MTTTSTTGHGQHRAPRNPPKLWRVPVSRIQPVTPHVIRITVGGEELADFPGGGGDQHVVLYFYREDAALPTPLTLESARAAFATARPRMRSYTVRRHDPVRHEIDIDFVVHGHPGPASAWAHHAQPGDPLILVGPSPAFRLDPAVSTHLLIGDETALPAIGAMLEQLPPSARAQVVVEVADGAEEQPLPTAANVRVDWVHRASAQHGGQTLIEAVRAAGVPAGDVLVWAAGERACVHALRQYFLRECGLDRRRVRANIYWQRGRQADQPGTARDE